jgi:hypothetical protein
MDPNTARTQVRDAIDALANATETSATTDALIADAVTAWRDLDDWLSGGGFRPTPWNAGMRS